MKATGMIRRLDSLNRITIPIEIIRKFGLKKKTKEEKGSALEIYIDNEEIILQRYAPGCIFCGNADTNELIIFRCRLVCIHCKDEAQHEL